MAEMNEEEFWDVVGRQLEFEIRRIFREELDTERKHMDYHRKSGDMQFGVVFCPRGCKWIENYYLHLSKQRDRKVD